MAPPSGTGPSWRPGIAPCFQSAHKDLARPLIKGAAMKRKKDAIPEILKRVWYNNTYNEMRDMEIPGIRNQT